MQKKAGEEVKKLKESTKIIIGMIIGLVLSTASYVLAENLINSKDVVYEDNSNLVADNVQDAIDGTCSKIDTRLSDIEDKLYTVKDMYMRKEFTSSTSPAYTGTSIDFPANSMCVISVQAGWYHARPLLVALSNSSSELTASTIQAIDEGDQQNFGNVKLIFYRKFTQATTLYVWTKYIKEELNDVYVEGFCATKYK